MVPRFRGSWALGALLLLARPSFAASPASAAADPDGLGNERAEAQQSYKRGIQLFDHGENRAALAEFERAYALAPVFRIYYNIAKVNTALDDPAAALRAYERYLAEGGSKVPAARSDEVEREISRLARRAAALRVEVQPASAQIFVDDVLVGTSPLPRHLWVNVGRHVVRAQLGEGAPSSKTVDLAGGDDKTLRFALEGAPSTPETTNTENEHEVSAPPTTTQPQHSPPWLAYGITGAFGAATVVTGVLALQARSDERNEQRTQGITAADLQDARHKVEHYALATDLLLAATAIGAGISIYLTLESTHSDDHSAALVLGPGHASARFTF